MKLDTAILASVNFSLSDSYRAINFSRNVDQTKLSDTKEKYFQHVGIYSYNYETLSTFVSLPRSKNEIHENLEQLRFLDNGYDIYLEEIEELSIGIDTETDYKKALKILNDND